MWSVLTLLLPPTVTIAPQIARIEVHLDTMSRAVNQRHRADKNVQGDILALRFENTDPVKARALIAESLRADWREEKGEWVLFRTPETLKAFADEEHASRKELLTRAMKHAQLGLEKPFDAAPVAARLNRAIKEKRGVDVEQVMRNGPLDRLARGLFIECDPAEIAKLRPFDRITYATKSASKLQRAIPESMQKRCKQFWSDFSALQSKVDHGDESLPSRLGAGDGQPYDPGKIIMTVARSSVKVNAYGADGRSLGSMTYYMTVPGTVESINIPNLPDVKVPREPRNGQEKGMRSGSNATRIPSELIRSK